MNLLAAFKRLFPPAREEIEAEVRNETRGQLLASVAGVADTPATRKRGLLKRDFLATGEGLLIVPCSGVHSYGMKFDIDVLYLDRKYRVRKARSAMKPWRVSICWGAHSVLELPSGVIASTGTKKGDQLAVLFLTEGKGVRSDRSCAISRR